MVRCLSPGFGLPARSRIYSPDVVDAAQPTQTAIVSYWAFSSAKEIVRIRLKVEHGSEIEEFVGKNRIRIRIICTERSEVELVFLIK